MRTLILAAILGFGAMLLGPGGIADAQAKPKGWHGHKGHHHGYSYGPRRHYGWQRGRHLGWYKHPHHRRGAYWRY